MNQLQQNTLTALETLANNSTASPCDPDPPNYELLEKLYTRPFDDRFRLHPQTDTLWEQIESDQDLSSLALWFGFAERGTPITPDTEEIERLQILVADISASQSGLPTVKQKAVVLAVWLDEKGSA